VTAASFEVEVLRDVAVPAGDSVALATDVFLPVGDGPRPVVLHRTPYDKNAVERRFGYSRWFAERGYVAVIQDVRGTFGSGGTLDLLVDEAADGDATLAWIEQQPWCDGTIGTWGTSYAAFTQLAAALSGRPSLRSMLPNQGLTSAWHNALRQGGAFELRWLGWVMWHSATNNQRELRQADWISAALNFGAPTTSDLLTRMPLQPGATQLSLVPGYERALVDMLRHGDYDEFWQRRELEPGRHVADFPPARSLLLASWYDTYARAQLELFSDLSEHDPNRARMIVGPWVHGTGAPATTLSGDIEFGAAASLGDLRELHLSWFEESLGRPAGTPGPVGTLPQAPLRLFIMGGGGGQRTATGHLFHGGRWRDEQEWPLARTDFRPLHLHGDGTLAWAASPAPEDCTTYTFDPDSPVPSIGGALTSMADVTPMPPGVTDTDVAGGSTRYRELLVPGGYDQVEHAGIFGARAPFLPLATRRDVLVFRTEPLVEDLEVTGPLQVRLWVSSTALDTDFTAKLIDEYPPSSWYPRGYALNISDGIHRLRYRNGGIGELLEPGTVAELVITLPPTSNLFVAGHRLRLDISSSNFPHFEVNRNTGEPAGRERRTVSADNTVWHDATRPSAIILPVIA
jgi:putative CocE/NonD family hydrolase